MRRLAIWIVAISCATLGAASAWAQERLALVVGVTEYGANREQLEAAGFIVPSRLPNAVRDAQLMDAALRAAGFTVRRVEDPTRRELLAAVNGFAGDLRAAGDGAIGVFYFAGHGAQGVPRFERDVDNFLIPVGTSLATETDLTDEAVGLSRISAQLSNAGADAVILILDACRNFALPRSDRSGFVPRGLAEARAYPGTMIAYSTAPGAVASDGPPGGNGPFAEALARELRAARATRIEDIFIEVREDVLAATDNAQTPWENASLRTRVTIGPPSVPPPAQPTPLPAPAVDPLQAVFDRLSSPCEYAMFTRDNPASPLAGLARVRAGGAPPCDEAPPAAAPTPTPVQPAPAPADPAAAARLAAERGLAVSQRVFRDCADCPEMVAVPSGTFLMGSPSGEAGRDEDEDDTAGAGGRQRSVTISRPFAVGRFEVTWAEWEACVRGGGCDGSGPSGAGGDEGWGTGTRPVINVDWNDAQSYVRWLSGKTGASYRLLSEAEWEYAARAGNSGRWTFGDTEARLGNYAWYSANSGRRTQPVGGRSANAFGLHDMHGNVWEWVEDCYADSYTNAPTDGRAFTKSSCADRVSRGGSWDSAPRVLRSANRYGLTPGSRVGDLGLRLARTL